MGSTRAAQMVTKRLRKPVHLVLDWDGTLTVKDTLAAVGSIPKHQHIRLGLQYSPLVTWDDMSQAFMTDYKIHRENFFPRQEKVGLSVFREWLNGLKMIEMRSTLRVQDAGFFRGATADDVKNAAKESVGSGDVELRAGWLDLFELFLPDRGSAAESEVPARISILSVNWSETFIRWSMWHAALQCRHPRQDELLRLINDMEICANEIQGLASPLGSSGQLNSRRVQLIQTSSEKLGALPPTAKMSSSGESASAPLAVVYVGDSPTDLECLVAADAGIWLSEAGETEYRQQFKDLFGPLDMVPTPLVTPESIVSETLRWAPDLDSVVRYLTD